MNPLKNILSNIVGNGLSSVSDLIKNFKMPPEKAAEFEIEKQKLLTQIEQKQLEIEQQVITASLTEIQAYLADVQNSRAMQIEALKQDDRFAKRFIYYLSIAYLLFAFAFILCFFFVHFPPENRDFINMAAGVVVGTGMVMILSFFFGSSKSSKDAQDALRGHLENLQKDTNTKN